MKSFRVYLSGGMEYTANEGKNWRLVLQEWLERELGCEVFNPNDESERFFRSEYPSVDFRQLKFQDIESYSDIAARLVELDCTEIANRSDIVIVYWDEGAMRGAGTKGELTMAKYFGKPVYMVTTEPLHEIPGWVLGCTTRMFPSFDALKDHLKSLRRT